MNIRPVGAELSRADGRTDTTKLIVAFRNFANAPECYNNNQHCGVSDALSCTFLVIYDAEWLHIP